jgi:hypothetical protein
MNRLIITNGSSAVGAIRNAGVEADFLSWDDVLHDGPVPAKSSLAQLSDVRAAFIAGQGWGTEEKIRARFKDRDDQFLEAIRPGDEQPTEIILWFEHDLYDQLQLIQILFETGKLYAANENPNPNSDPRLNLSLICHDHFVAITGTDQLLKDLEGRQRVTAEQIVLATEAWDAFTSTNPRQLKSFQESCPADVHVLPYLRDALGRLLEEYPNPDDGLSKTERSILHCLAAGRLTGAELFRAQQRTEQAAFMGDGSFEHILLEMLPEPRPLVQQITDSNLNAGEGENKDESEAANFARQTFDITQLGKAVLSGAKSVINNAPERWIGGIRIGK